MSRIAATQWTRRAFLAGSATALAAGRVQSQGRDETVFAYVGCFTTTQRYARGDGIHVYRTDLGSGTWNPVQQVGDLVNPSFLTVSRDQRFLYSVHGDEEHATSFSVDQQTGRLTQLNRARTGGRNGVHLALDPSSRFLIVANYSSGGVSVLPVRRDGSLADVMQVVPLPGQPGPHRVEQASAHPHHVVFDPSGRFVVVPDKGLDRVFAFRFDPASGQLSPTAQGSSMGRSGSGPRHAAFHPRLPVLWVLNEINSSIAAFYWDAERGHMRPTQILPTLPPEYTGENTASEIAVSSNGRFVYCSNRGHDSVAIFSADAGTGLLSTVGWEPSQGRTPRFIGLDPSHRFLLVANEQSDTIRTWRADAETGRLTPVGQTVKSPSPVAITFVRLEPK